MEWESFDTVRRALNSLDRKEGGVIRFSSGTYELVQAIQIMHRDNVSVVGTSGVELRFSTVVKDAKDTAYVFLGLAVGMAAGTGSYFLAIVGTDFLSTIALVLNWANYGALHKSEFVLRFSFEKSRGSEDYLNLIQENARLSNLLHIQPSGDGQFLNRTCDINLRDGVSADEFVSAINALAGVSEKILIASKNDVDF